MVESEEELVERLRELVKDSAKVLASAEEAARHQSTGDLTAVAEVVGLMHYPLGQVGDEVGGILRHLAARGVRPSSN